MLHDKANFYLFFLFLQLKEIAEGTILESGNRVTFDPSNSPLADVEFEGYYNRDSTKYMDIYNIPEAETVLRGTYRYKVLTAFTTWS